MGKQKVTDSLRSTSLKIYLQFKARNSFKHKTDMTLSLRNLQDKRFWIRIKDLPPNAVFPSAVNCHINPVWIKPIRSVSFCLSKMKPSYFGAALTIKNCLTIYPWWTNGLGLSIGKKGERISLQTSEDLSPLKLSLIYSLSPAL